MNNENPNPNLTKLLTEIESLFAQWERQRLIERMQDGKRRKAEERKAKGGQP